jgi:hypothetical protein
VLPSCDFASFVVVFVELSRYREPLI